MTVTIHPISRVTGQRIDIGDTLVTMPRTIVVTFDEVQEQQLRDAHATLAAMVDLLDRQAAAERCVRRPSPRAHVRTAPEPLDGNP
ncbi:hypothetical protein AB2L57_10745 [Microbacterium sp. HA-8]|uniref:hypothetical protein n=1 Tax=Microbacterium sp. HA-8 TaxID=3234200 RepID=UPI0038F6BB6C